jgi:hypothetical protein
MTAECRVLRKWARVVPLPSPASLRPCQTVPERARLLPSAFHQEPRAMRSRRPGARVPVVRDAATALTYIARILTDTAEKAV